MLAIENPARYINHMGKGRYPNLFGEDVQVCHKARKFFHLEPTGDSLSSRRGEKILKATSVLLKKIMSAIE
ncbi:MAG TPA: hypothetical protein DEQ20_05575 [Desulfobulbaceae bacterium]|nr:hypothetical protein [Desulfobulbaceae bacterium]